MEDYLISMAVSIFLNALKGPQKKAQIRSVALKIYRAIKATYPLDPDFQ